MSKQYSLSTTPGSRPYHAEVAVCTVPRRGAFRVSLLQEPCRGVAGQTGAPEHVARRAHQSMWPDGRTRACGQTGAPEHVARQAHQSMWPDGRTRACGQTGAPEHVARRAHQSMWPDGRTRACGQTGAPEHVRFQRESRVCAGCKVLLPLLIMQGQQAFRVSPVLLLLLLRCVPPGRPPPAQPGCAGPRQEQCCPI
jgi:hypothetical protein